MKTPKAKFRLSNKNKPELLCSLCNKVIKYDKQFTEEDWKAFKNEIQMDAQICSNCEDKLYE